MHRTHDPRWLRLSLTASSVLLASTASAASWYVDKDATGAGDGSSWADAWPSFAAVAWGPGGVQAGDTLFVSGGPSAGQKIYQEPLTVGASGTASQPITIALDGANADHNGTVVLDHQSTAEDTAIYVPRDYVTIDGNVGGSSHFQITNLFDPANKDARHGISAGGNPTTGLVIGWITFDNVNNPIWIASSGGVTGFEIHDCSFTQTKGDVAIGLGGSSGQWDAGRVHHNTIEVVVGDQGGPDGIQLSSGVSVYANRFRVVTGTPAPGQHPDQLQATGDYLKVYANDFVDIGDSAFDYDTYGNTTPHDIWIFDNVFRIVTDIDPYPEYIRLYNSMSDPLLSLTNIKIMNNTFVDNPAWTPIRMSNYQGQPTATGNEIKNNIFVNTGDGTEYFPLLDIEPSDGFTADSFAFASNVYSCASGTPYLSFEGTSYTAADFIAAHDPSGKTLAPTFVSYAPGDPNDDFHLAASDPVAIDSGVDLGSYFTIDKDGATRPAGAGWDIGAYEYGASVGGGGGGGAGGSAGGGGPSGGAAGAGAGNAGNPAESAGDEGGCGCSLPGQRRAGTGAALAVLGLVLARLRRKRALG